MRHEAFITHKLAVSFVALAFAPFFLAYSGAPTPAQTILFTLGLAPLAAAMLVARTGRMLAGQALLVCGLIAFCVALSLGSTSGFAAPLAWLVLAQWEAGRSDDRRLTRVSAILSGGAFGVVVACSSHFGAVFAGGPSAMLVGGLALAYAITGARSPAPVNLGQEATAHETHRLRALTEAIGDLVVDFDKSGSVVEVGGRSDLILGLTAPALVAGGLFQIVHVADRPAFLKLIADAARSDETQAATIRLRVENVGVEAFGHRFLWVEMRMRASTGAGVVAVLRDVSATHQRERDMEAAHRSIETSVRSKDDFLANMSHELRTPLNAIIGFSEMLSSQTMRPVEPDKQREYARIIHQSGQHLLSLVNSILDMSKIRSGTFELIPDSFDLRPLIDQCCDIVRLKAQEGGVRLVQDYPERLEDVIGDKRAYRQILINLLSNAVKFTPENGDVKVSIKPDGTAILVTVSDTGIGIGSDDLLRLGDPFFQVRSSFSRPYEGTGLGLSVVRGLIGLHGGTMTIESEPDKGTSVTARLPLDCRPVVNQDSIATIETIPRRRQADTVSHPHESRIRSIA